MVKYYRFKYDSSKTQNIKLGSSLDIKIESDTLSLLRGTTVTVSVLVL